MNRAMILDLLDKHRDEFLKRFGARHLALFGSAARDELRNDSVLVYVNGEARISVDPALMQRFAMQGQLPKCVLVLSVHKVFFQCARALARSRLWEARPADEPRTAPTAGEMLAAVTQGGFDGASYDRELPARQASTLY